MELTTRGRYAVMAMADLAQHDQSDPVTLTAISTRQRLSLAYLEQLFAALRRAGLVMSVRGRSGGYRLARSSSSIFLSEILRAVSEETKMTLCSETSGKGCLGEERCITHKLWQSLGSHIASFFSSVTLEEVVKGGPFIIGFEHGTHLEKRVAAE